ncbi:hypothetical protein [Nocardia vermiculata]|uniref:Uncharacterized protein n=1 Tax=Nocardia vermiculata TaxID=257274 RepID=A0A846Y459_9NOCA|nr:hypothetical protein [Nocardia vermiculata]NKY53617.1 hypothetical protein [Nocardia vermiculata]
MSNIQQAVGSSSYATLDAGGDTVPGGEHTAVASRWDEVTNPYYGAFLRTGAGARRVCAFGPWLIDGRGTL